MGPEDRTIETTFGDDYCLSCGCPIEDCGNDCPVLQLIAEHMKDEYNAG